METRKRERLSRPFVGVRAGSPASEPTPASPSATEGLGVPAPLCVWGEAPLILTVVLSSVAQQVWFKNRRAKWRRQKRSSSEESENAEKWNKTSSKASPEKREEEGKSDLDSDS